MHENFPLRESGDIYYIPGICQPARNHPGIDFSGNRSLGALACYQLSEEMSGFDGKCLFIVIYP